MGGAQASRRFLCAHEYLATRLELTISHQSIRLSLPFTEAKMPNKRSLRKPETSNTSLGTAYDKTLDTPFNSVLGFDDTSPSANTTSSKVENDRSCSPQQ